MPCKECVIVAALALVIVGVGAYHYGWVGGIQAAYVPPGTR
jgi:hypothetical protein